MDTPPIIAIGIVGFWVVLGALWIGRMYERSRRKGTSLTEEMHKDSRPRD